MTPRRIYLDTCCFVELALDAKGAKLAEGGKFVWYLRTLLRAARDKSVVVVTSMFTIAECIHADADMGEDVQRLFRALLTSGTSGVTPWQADIFVFERARDLRWKHGINVKPADSVHIGTALEAKCDEFLTWDGISGERPKSILKASTEIAKLGLQVLLPDNTSSIPDEYRQGALIGGSPHESQKEKAPQS